MDNEKTMNAPDMISSGMNTSDMCSQCKCMMCNRGPEMYKCCNHCMDCRGPVNICPSNNFEHK